MSTLAIRAPLPKVVIMSATWSTEIYASEHSSYSMPSLTLHPGGGQVCDQVPLPWLMTCGDYSKLVYLKFGQIESGGNEPSILPSVSYLAV